MEPRIRAARLPPGAKTYFTAGELPSDGAWVRLRGQLDDAPNLGLLARWTAAIAEIRAYYQADERARYRILRAFEVMVPELLASSPHITLHAVAPKAFESDRLRLLESKTTVYPFILVKEGAQLGQHQLLDIWRWTNEDMSQRLPHATDGQQATLEPSYHLGQPVALHYNRHLWALRVALGAPLVVRLTEDHSLGETLDARLEWLRDVVMGLRRKLELLVVHYDAIKATEREQDIAPRWGDRIAVVEAAQIVQHALGEGMFDDQRALLFHDLERMRGRVAALKGAFPNTALHAVAVKANPVLSILKELVAMNAGLECASIEEVHLALAAGCPPERVVYDSPAKTCAEIDKALRLGLHLNADNFDELERIDDWIARNGPTHAVVGLRINPMVGAGRIATTSVGHAVSKFGVPISERAAIVEAARRWPWLSALHIHVGSQGCGLALLVEGVAKLIDLVHAIEDATEVNRITHLDIGGGLPVAYRSDEQPPSLEDYIEALRTEVPELLSGRFRLLTEFGRGIQANCGFAVSRVEYVKHVHGVQMAVVHLGADMFLRPVYHPKDWTHMFAVFDPQGRPKTGPKQAWTIVGPLCFGGDVIGRDRALPAIEAGDLLLIRDTGAYTLSMWSMHCSRGQPPVVGFDTDQLKVIRESQSPQGLVDYWGPHPRG